MRDVGARGGAVALLVAGGLGLTGLTGVVAGPAAAAPAAPAVQAQPANAAPVVGVSPRTVQAAKPTRSLVFGLTVRSKPVAGVLTVQVPAGFTTPQTTRPRQPGYVTAASICRTFRVTGVANGPSGSHVVSVAVNCAARRFGSVTLERPTAPTAGGSYAFPVALTPTGTTTVTVLGTPTVKVLGKAPVAISSVMLSPQSATVVVGDGQAYTVTGYDGNGQSVGDVTDRAVFSISPDGSCAGATCTAQAPGTHNVFATVQDATNGTITGSASLTVNPVPPASIVLSPNPQTVTTGQFAYWTVTGYDANGASLGDVTAQATLTSNDPSVQCGIIAGICTTNGPGTYTVTARDGAASSSATLVVQAQATPSIDLSVTLGADNATPAPGSVVTLTAVVTNTSTTNGSGAVTGQVTLPAGLTYTANLSGEIYNGQAGLWLLNTLAPGASRTLVITATVSATPPAELPVRVSVTQQPPVDPNPANDSATVTLHPTA